MSDSDHPDFAPFNLFQFQSSPSPVIEVSSNLMFMPITRHNHSLRTASGNLNSDSIITVVGDVEDTRRH